MPRPRTNDPSNLPDIPNPTTDPKRQDELIKELQNRLKFLTESYALAQHIYDDQDSFNESLERLRRGLERKRVIKRKGKRLHPEIELLLSYHARYLAKLDNVKLNKSHIRAAAEYVTKTIKPRRGRPHNHMLEHHVEGLVAIVQEFSGKPVLSQRYKDSVYAPEFPEGISKIIPLIVQKWDTKITTTQLVNMVQKIRRKYAGKPMRFLDIFPGYSIYPKDGVLIPPPNLAIETLELNIPIYCP